MKQMILNLINNKMEAINIPERLDFTEEEIKNMAFELYLGKKINCCYNNQSNTINTRLIAYKGIIRRGDGIRLLEFEALHKRCKPIMIHEYIIIDKYKEKHPIKYRNLIKEKNILNRIIEKNNLEYIY